MINKVKNIGYAALLVLSLGSCKKSIDDKFNNPEKTSTVSIPYMFTAMLNNDRVRPSYWNYRTFVLTATAEYAQTDYLPTSNTVYQPNDGYMGNRWEDFYHPTGNGSGPMALYKVMEGVYNKMSADDKKTNDVIMNAARVTLYDQASQMVDCWGDIPFSEASSLETSASVQNGKFDDQKALYKTFIDGLDAANTYFASAQLSTLAANSFTKQDILLGGSVDKWRRYTNSIRLRLLMRMSFYDENTAKTEVTKMLSNPTQYPLIDGGSVGSYSPSSSDVLLTPLTNYTNSLQSALTEGGSFYAPDYMLNKVMNPSNDPRIPVVYDKYGQTINNTFVPNATYRAMPIDLPAAQQESDATKYAIVDSVTFLTNSKLPGIVITAPEVNFLKAEAFERWGGGDAKAAYETAVTQSVYFYYYLNSLGTGTKPVLNTASIAPFLSSSVVAYTGAQTDKLAKIWTQKWVHFGFMQGTQAWAEYRRTKYPQLTFPSTGKLSGYTTPPNRLTYPSIERGFNSHYADVRAKDTRDAKIFWDVK
ncbi:SusD/RagB family nutrient-binding outer membrane lipoprotein [Mucilaginibacter sp. RS28]|uniref:SusD/RagB family nutrient-binding outer membrane lipoprotein n=1 Tax=Mucilaginibacter straminoryzae TaxID=2932774 RepID=A0A9X1X265_9SPHI|nr:SusD/RagB family nutrient-binding outer membrane lipoprotein [Mucilaginibacter straminoryzae]MCJ8209256.1 SusD/RagB family nutrient-binding outer membrane lipoprotein [Mucilaginibacter straminoryzae]